MPAARWVFVLRSKATMGADLDTVSVLEPIVLSEAVAVIVWLPIVCGEVYKPNVPCVVIVPTVELPPVTPSTDHVVEAEVKFGTALNTI